MTRRIYAPVALLALAALAFPVQASVVFTSPDGAVTTSGKPVSAKLEVSVKRGSLVVHVENTTRNIKGLEQTLRGVSFSLYNKKANGKLAVSSARIGTFGPNGFTVGDQSKPVEWSMVTSGDTYLLRSPGGQETILPEGGKEGFKGADQSLLGTGNREFVAGGLDFVISVPGLGETEDISNVRFYWANGEESLLEPHISDRTAGEENNNFASSDFSTPGSVQTMPFEPPTAENFIGNFYQGEMTPIGVNSPVSSSVGGGFMSIASDQKAAAQVSSPSSLLSDYFGNTDNPGESTPSVSNDPVIPEPASLGLLGLGALSLLVRRK